MPEYPDPITGGYLPLFLAEMRRWGDYPQTKHQLPPSVLDEAPVAQSDLPTERIFPDNFPPARPVTPPDDFTTSRSSLAQSLPPVDQRLIDVPNERFAPQTPRGNLQADARDAQAFFGSLSPMTRAMIMGEGGMTKLTAQFAGARQAAAAEQQKALQAQQTKQRDQALKVFLDNNTPWSARSKALSQMNDPYSQSLARIGSEQIAANFPLVGKYLPENFVRQWEQDPNSITPAVAEIYFKQAGEMAKKDVEFQTQNQRVENIRQRLFNKQPVTMEEWNTYKKASQDSEKMDLEMEMERRKLQEQGYKTTLAGAPKPLGAIQVGSDVQQRELDPQTGKVTTFTGQKSPGVSVTIDQGRKFSVEEAGRLSGLVQGLSEIDATKSALLLPDGTVDRSVLFSAAFGGLPFSVGRDINRWVEDSVETLLRLRSGAQINESEFKRLTKLFTPSKLDSDKTIRGRLDGLARYYRRIVDFVDESGRDIRARLPHNEKALLGPPQLDPKIAFDIIKNERPAWSDKEVMQEMVRRGFGLDPIEPGVQ